MEALHQLHIFIFILDVVYVVFCALTIVLGGIKLVLVALCCPLLAYELGRYLEHHPDHCAAYVQSQHCTSLRSRLTDVNLVLKMLMGSMFKQTIFDESTQDLVMDWVQNFSVNSDMFAICNIN